MKFSIRDLLLVTVIVALALGWWLDRVRQPNRAEAREQLHWENFRTLLDNRNASEFQFDGEGRLSVLQADSSAPAPNASNRKSL